MRYGTKIRNILTHMRRNPDIPKLKPGAGRCGVCLSPHGRDAIDLAIVSGHSYASIAQRFGVPARSVAAHAKNHLTPQQRAALLTAAAADDSGLGYDKLADVEREGVLAAVIKQRARLFMLADQCRDGGDVTGAIAAEAAIGRNLTLGAKIIGRFAATQISHTHQHVLLSADYLSFRKRLLAALATIPAEHRQTVAAALHAGEAEAAAQIAPPQPAAPEPIEAEFVEVSAEPELPPCPVPLPRCPVPAPA
ncbi:hypothetical protein QA649_27940 [Bradyrhizobium sp. CB1717]|uniref:hypothetical protein n=1 Tax=Bradyrhizobium sp. CB1717 TaxID=3039154 RepID=UPI0024B1F13F|nr:hypothetical protein [Bradyrhizobium sp. CB1717]WFU21920.1 hypothetical protein QA649_27940 [Bradyrhizobium sp. CB1717]